MQKYCIVKYVYGVIVFQNFKFIDVLWIDLEVFMFIRDKEIGMKFDFCFKI